MKNKLTLIILSIAILLCGLMISCDSKPSGKDYIGTWKEDSILDHELIIEKQSDTTYSIQRTSTKENVIGELKDGVIHGKLAGYDFLYSLNDGVITETTPKEKIQYKKEK